MSEENRLCRENMNNMTDNMTDDTATTHFGFRTVEEDAKQSMVNEVFTGVAWRYDLMNDAMSAGLHRAWKDHLIAMLSPSADMHLLDVAGGTGDIAARFLRAGGGSVTLCDINPAMLEQGRRRLLDEGLYQSVRQAVGNAEALPCDSRSADAYTIAFGIRNVTHIERVLEEACRVLKPGSRFLCLEFSHPATAWLRTLYDRYSFDIIPRLGRLLAGDAESYQYLVESIRRFPEQKTFAEMIREAGFEQVSYTNLTGGIVAIHSGWKI